VCGKEFDKASPRNQHEKDAHKRGENWIALQFPRAGISHALKPLALLDAFCDRPVTSGKVVIEKCVGLTRKD